MTLEKPVALGFRAGRGGSLVVAITMDDSEPRLVQSTFLATADEGDRLAFEPYHVAFEMAEGKGGEIPEDAVAAVAEGRQRQEVLAVQKLGEIVGRLRGEGWAAKSAALLVNRAGWMTDLLQYSLFDPSHPPVAEGLAVRDAQRSAIERCGIKRVEMDEKSMPEAAQVKLGLSPGGLEARLKALGAGVKPWRKEHRLAGLAAWLAAAAV